jgi:hypothetical protein
MVLTRFLRQKHTSDLNMFNINENHSPAISDFKADCFSSVKINKNYK